MAGLQQLAKIGDALGSLDDVAGLLERYGAFKEKYEALVAGLTEVGAFVSTAEDVIGLVLTQTPSPAVDAVFEALSLKDDVDAIRARFQGNETLKPFLKPVDAVSEKFDANKIDSWSYGTDDCLVALPLFEKAGDVAIPAGRFDFALNAEGGATLACEAGALWPYRGDNVSEPLLRLGARLHVGAGARAAGSILGIKLGLGGEAKADCAVQYFFQPQQKNGIFAVETAHAIRQLANPFDFQELWTKFAHSKLCGLIIKVDGSASFGLEIGIAQDVIASRLVSATAGLSFTVNVKREGRYELSLRSGRFTDAKDARVRLVLSRSDGKITSRSVQAGLDFDLSGLGAKVHGELKAALETWDNSLEKFKEFLTPGTYLRTKLAAKLDESVKALVKNEAFRSAIAGDLEIALGLDAGAESAIADLLKSRIADRADDVAGMLSKAEGDAEAWISKLAEKLPTIVSDKAKPALIAELNKLTSALREKLEEEVEAFVATPGEKLGDKLRAIGAKVSGKVNAADEALEAIRSVITQYDALFRKIVDEAGNQARRKIAIRIAYEKRTESAQGYDLIGDFMPKSATELADCAKLFDRIISGDLDSVRDLFDPKKPQVAGFALNRGESGMSRFARTEETLGFESIILGFGVSGKRIIVGEADVKSVGLGRIHVDAEGEYSRVIEGPAEGRKVSLFNAFSLAALRSPSGEISRQGVMTGSFNMVHSDKDLNTGECVSFFENLREIGLISSAVSEEVIGKFRASLDSAGKNGKFRGEIELNLIVSNAQVRRLMQLDTKPSGVLDDAQKEKLMVLALNALTRTKAWKADDYREGLQYIRKKAHFGPVDGKSDQNILRDAARFVISQNDAKKDVPKEHDIEKSMKRAFAFANYVGEMRTIALATPTDADNPPSGSWNENDYRAAEIRLSRYAKSWIKVNEEILGWLKADMHPTTSALLVALVAGGNGIELGAENAPAIPDNSLLITLSQTGKKALVLEESYL